MRNLLFFILLLIAVFYVRRALRQLRGGGRPRPDAGRGAPAAGARPEIEQMLACAHCGLHVPESEGVRGADGFFCSEAHRRLGSLP